MNTEPLEVISAPYIVYKAPVGTAFPKVNETPGAAWAKIGTSGDLNYDRATGVMVQHNQTSVAWRSAGDVGTRKKFRTEESLLVGLKVVDLTLEQYAAALNSNSVTTVSAVGAVAAYKKIGLSRGNQIATMALLIRGLVSPYSTTGNMQYEIPLAQQDASSQVALSKPGEPAGLDLSFDALVDVNAASADERFGRLVAQTATSPTVTITSSSIASPTVITTSAPHGLTSGQTVLIAGHTSVTPEIDGEHVATVTGASTFTIPVNVTADGVGGTVTLV